MTASKKTKILNLDTFGGDAARTISIGGVEYPVEDMSFENFVETTRAAQQLEADGKATAADQMEASVNMIQRSVPTIPADVLRKLSLVKLGVIVKFLRGDLDRELEQAAAVETAAAAEAGGEEAKK